MWMGNDFYCSVLEANMQGGVVSNVFYKQKLDNVYETNLEQIDGGGTDGHWSPSNTDVQVAMEADIEFRLYPP